MVDQIVLIVNIEFYKNIVLFNEYSHNEIKARFGKQLKCRNRQWNTERGMFIFTHIIFLKWFFFRFGVSFSKFW